MNKKSIENDIKSEIENIISSLILLNEPSKYENKDSKINKKNRIKKRKK